MNVGFMLFLGLVVLGLYYSRQRELRKEQNMRRALHYCYTRDEQYQITRAMYAKNLDVPEVLPPLLNTVEEPTEKKQYFVQEVESRGFIRLYAGPDEVDDEFDSRSEAGTCTTLHPAMYGARVPLTLHQTGPMKGQIRIFEGTRTG